MKWTQMRWLALVLLLAVIGATPFCFSQQPGVPGTVQTARSDAPAVGNIAEHPLKRAIDLARAANDQAQRVQDYTFIMVKRESVGGKLTPHDAVFMKIRAKPFSIYALTLGPVRAKDYEAIFVEGRNNNKALIHVTGFQHKLMGIMSFDPTDPMVMEGSRYPMTTAGYTNMMKSVLQLYELEAKQPENDVQIFTGAKVDGRPCTCVQNSHPVRRPEFPFQMTRVFYDEQNGLPLRWEAYDWPARAGEPPQLVEEYTYRNVKLNPGLTDLDFDVNNPAYRYK